MRTISKPRLFMIGVVIFVLILFLTDLVSFSPPLVQPNVSQNEVRKIQDDETQFEGFDNVTGAGRFIVPNIIHFIYYNKTELKFVDYVVLRAAMRNHKPEKFFIHSNIPNLNLTGSHWDLVRQDHELWSRIKVKYLEAPDTIFGQTLSTGWRLHHGSDIGRIRLLMKYGGIYLDNDVYVINSLDKYRKYEFVINWDENQFMGTQVLIAHKNARFLRAWLETYKEYHSDRWYYNAGERPTVEVLYHHPELIHRVKGDFGAATGVSVSLYKKNPGYDWRKLDAVHLLINHRSYLDPNYEKLKEFDQTNIQTYDYPFGEMAREALEDREEV